MAPLLRVVAQYLLSLSLALNCAIVFPPEDTQAGAELTGHQPLLTAIWHRQGRGLLSLFFAE